ncbi:MAG TPA: hypothetical protein VFD58_31645 [Blastocatellia bacterium]|nr:hypothetical protein [Blastocatellia bacterium]
MKRNGKAKRRPRAIPSGPVDLSLLERAEDGEWLTVTDPRLPAPIQLRVTGANSARFKNALARVQFRAMRQKEQVSEDDAQDLLREAVAECVTAWKVDDRTPLLMNGQAWPCTQANVLKLFTMSFDIYAGVQRYINELAAADGQGDQETIEKKSASGPSGASASPSEGQTAETRSAAS